VTPRVADALGRAVVVAAPDDSLAAVRALMIANQVDHVAVVGHGRLLGLVAAADIDAAHPSRATTLTVLEIRAALEAIPARRVMREVPAVAPGTPLAEAARLMREGDLCALPVLRGHTVVGLLTDLDVLACISGEAAAAAVSPYFTVPSSCGNAPSAIIPGMRECP
jgi:CBS domain-containing protein